MSVIVVGFEKKKSAKGGSFMVLKLEGGVEMQLNEDTGKWYAAAMRTNIIAAVDEATCKNLVGTELPGKIVKLQCMPYSYTVRSTGKVVTLNHRFVYQGEEIVPALAVAMPPLGHDMEDGVNA